MRRSGCGASFSVPGRDRAMRLSLAQRQRFYAVWKPLLLFVNRRRQVGAALPEAAADRSWDVQEVYAVRESLWADDSILDDFVAENPADLSPADLELVASWRHRVAGTFC